MVVPPEARTVLRTRIKGNESLPRDVTERKRVQRRKRRAARKAEIEANKKTVTSSDATVPMMDAKTLNMTRQRKRALRETEEKYGKTGRLRRSTIAPPRPELPKLNSGASVVRDGIELRMNLDLDQPDQKPDKMHRKKADAPQPETPGSKAKPKPIVDGLEKRMGVNSTPIKKLRPKPAGSKRRKHP